jgi:3,4-dihydroxy-9,10-secoandrosta-1,3,5(10)-triene-9,17-dione 4,5-dioxygenase
VPVRSLGYLRLRTAKLDEWRSFATDVLGLMPVEGRTAGALHYRIDDRPPRLVVSPADAPGIEALGLEVADERELSEVVAGLKSAGVDVTDGTGSEAAARCVQGLVRCQDPSGTVVEIYYGPVLDHVRLDTPLVSGFVTGPMGMGHAVIAAPDMDASFRFWTEVLGFRARSSMRIPMGPDHSMWIRFLGCNPRHHTIALMESEFPGELVHFMLEVETIDDVGLLLDRCAEHRVTLQASLGRHTNDKVLSTYLVGPEDAAVEVGTGGVRVDDTTWTVDEITKVSFWGHRFVPAATDKLRSKPKAT